MLNKPKFRLKDVLRNVLTYGGALISFSILLLIVVNIFIEGAPLMNMNLIMNNYESVTYVTELKPDVELDTYEVDIAFRPDVYYSIKWGIALRDDIDLLGNNVIFIDYVHEDSTLLVMLNKGVGQEKLTLMRWILLLVQMYIIQVSGLLL